MIAVFTRHWAKPGRFDEALALLDGNGAAQSRTPGFVSRVSALSRSDASEIDSFVVWENEAVYEQWKASAERRVSMRGAEEFWAKPPQSERFDVPG